MQTVNDLFYCTDFDFYCEFFHHAVLSAAFAAIEFKRRALCKVSIALLTLIVNYTTKTKEMIICGGRFVKHELFTLIVFGEYNLNICITRWRFLM